MPSRSAWSRPGTEAGELYWQLPLWAELKDQIKSEIADMLNTGGRPGGAITAALIMSEFTEGKPWVHLDIAGAAWTSKEGPYTAQRPDRRRRARAGELP